MADPTQQSATTIGGFVYAASYLFESSVTFRYGGAVSSYLYKGSLANEMVQLDSNYTYNTVSQDPMGQMLDTMREITFRAAVTAGKDKSAHSVTNAPQHVTYRGSQMQSIYVTEFRCMVAAAILSLYSIFAL
jgi:hypothetical protein